MEPVDEVSDLRLGLHLDLHSLLWVVHELLVALHGSRQLDLLRCWHDELALNDLLRNEVDDSALVVHFEFLLHFIQDLVLLVKHFL